MIRRILISVLLVLLGTVLSAQNIQNRANSQVTVQDMNLFTGTSFKLPAFADTIKANQAYTLDSCGRMIYTYKTNTLWYRACSPKRWVEIKSTAVPPAIQNGLISGGIVTQIDSVTYAVSPAVYVINSVQYTAQADTFTIAPFDTLPRIDLIGADTSGAFYLDTGVANIYPLAPTPNPQTQVGISFIFVSTDTSSSSTIIYNNANVAIENTLFVSKNGNDSSGMRTMLTKPFLTIGAAVNAAQNGDMIVVYPGFYSEKNLEIEKNISIYLYDSATVYSNQSIGIYIKTNSVIDGYGSILTNGYPAIVLYSDEDEDPIVTIRAKYISSLKSTTSTIVNDGMNLNLFVDFMEGGGPTKTTPTNFTQSVFKQINGSSNVRGNIYTTGPADSYMISNGLVKGIECYSGLLTYDGNISSTGNCIYADNGNITFSGNAISSDNNAVVLINGSKVVINESLISTFGTDENSRNGIVHQGNNLSLRDVQIECADTNGYSITTFDEESKEVYVYNSCYATNRFKDTTNSNTLALNFVVGRENILIKDSLYAHASLDTSHHVPVRQLAHNNPMDGWVIKYDSVNNRAVWDSVSAASTNENFANTDLTATGNRFHDFNYNDLQIDNLKNFIINSTAPGILPNLISVIKAYPTYINLSTTYDDGITNEFGMVDVQTQLALIKGQRDSNYSTIIAAADSIVFIGNDTTIGSYHYLFPKSNPDSNEVLGYVGPNTLGWVNAGSSTVTTNNVLYVAKNGNNSTGTRNELTKPYLTIQAAVNAASKGDMVYVYPGTYAEQVKLRDSVNIYLTNGARIANNTTYVVTDSGFAVNCVVDGYGEIINTSTGAVKYAIHISNASSNINIKAKYVECSGSSGASLYVGNGTVNYDVTKTYSKLGGGNQAVNAIAGTVYLKGEFISDLDYTVLISGATVYMDATVKALSIGSFGNSGIHMAGNGYLDFTGSSISNKLFGLEQSGGTAYIHDATLESKASIAADGSAISAYGGDTLRLSNVILRSASASAKSIENQTGFGPNIYVFTSSYASNMPKVGGVRPLKWKFGKENLLVKDTMYAHATLDTSSKVIVGQLAYNTPTQGQVITYDTTTKKATWATATSIDTTSLSNRIDGKIDSLYISNDSVYAYKNNTWVYQYLAGVKTNNVLYVAKNGDNTTARRNRLTNPFLTVQAAIDSATSGDLVYVYPGTYIGGVILKNGVNLYLSDGVKLNSSGQYVITDNNVAVNCIIDGYGEINNTYSGASAFTAHAIWVRNSSSNVDIKAKLVSVSGGSFSFGSCLYMQNGTVNYNVIKSDATLGNQTNGFSIQNGNATIKTDLLHSSGNYAIDIYNSSNVYFNGSVSNTNPIQKTIFLNNTSYLKFEGIISGTGPCLNMNNTASAYISNSVLLSTDSSVITCPAGSLLELDNVILKSNSSLPSINSYSQTGPSIKVYSSSYASNKYQTSPALNFTFGKQNMLVKDTLNAHASLDTNGKVITGQLAYNTPTQGQIISYDSTTKRAVWSAADTATVVRMVVRNAESTTLTRGTVVYLFGASGDRASAKRANNKADSTSANTIGFVQNDIVAGDTGWVITQGQVQKLNLNAYTSGQIIYLDSISGQFTATKPQAPYHMVYLGVIERANNGNGILYARPQNGYELDEIHNVQITNPTNNQILVYSDTAKAVWKNRSVYAIVDTTNTIQTKFRSDTMRINVYSTLNDKLNSSDSSTYQTKFRSDTMRTNIYNTKQDRSIASYSMMANNTNATANMTAQTFRDAGLQTYTIGTTGAVSWTGTTPPSGTANHSYQWTQVGKLVTLRISLIYGTAGSALTQVTIGLPSDCPIPQLPTGVSGASANISYGTGWLLTSNTSLPGTGTFQNVAVLRINAANNGYDIITNKGGGAYAVAHIMLNYFAQ